MELYAEAFDAAGALDKLEGFASFHGADFYGLPRNSGTLTLKRESWTVPDSYAFGEAQLKPLRGGETLRWKARDRVSTMARRVALLIDADNLSPDVAEKAIADLTARGFTITVLRAYGSPETLSAARTCCRNMRPGRWSNQGKGTTDAALVVDAMDLLHAGGLPPTVAIGSSDADFAPLAVRLRETGREVLCYAPAGQGRRRRAATRVRRGGFDWRAASSVRGGPGAAPRPLRPAAAEPGRARRPAKPPARKASAAPAPAADPAADRAGRMLEQVPGFLEGEAGASSTTSSRCCATRKRWPGARARPASSGRLGLPIELTPARTPNKLRRLDGVA